MATTAGSVQTFVIKGAGGAAGATMDCAAIFQAFDPPIEMGSHEEMQGSRANYQAEHVPPCSNFHDSGRGGPRIPGCSNYNTGSAMTWNVFDGQCTGAEHKALTDAMRLFSKANEAASKNATLKEWMDEYEEATKKCLRDSKTRKSDEKLDADDLAAAAAKCIRQAVDASLAGKVDQNTPLRNGQARGKPPTQPPPALGSSGGSAA